jgi:hypothetical protein
MTQIGVAEVQVHHPRRSVPRHQIDLVDDEPGRDVVNRRRDQEAVQKARVEGRKFDRLHAPDPVDVGHEDVLLPSARPCSPPAQLVDAVVNLGDKPGVVLLSKPNGNPVADGNGVGNVLGFEAKLPPNP